MENLEKIVKVLVDNASKLRGNSSIDMSMFLEEQVPKIYSLAAEDVLEKKDFESAGSYLFHAKKWDRLLECGDNFYHSEFDEERRAGRHFLEICICLANLNIKAQFS